MYVELKGCRFVRMDIVSWLGLRSLHRSLHQCASGTSHAPQDSLALRTPSQLFLVATTGGSRGRRRISMLRTEFTMVTTMGEPSSEEVPGHVCNCEVSFHQCSTACFPIAAPYVRASRSCKTSVTSASMNTTRGDTSWTSPLSCMDWMTKTGQASLLDIYAEIACTDEVERDMSCKLVVRSASTLGRVRRFGAVQSDHANAHGQGGSRTPEVSVKCSTSLYAGGARARM